MCLDLDLERRVQESVRELVSTGIAPSATDVADGGLAVALAELALASGIGIECDERWTKRLEQHELGRADAVLFGEAPSRVLVAADPARATDVEAIAAAHNVA